MEGKKRTENFDNKGQERSSQVKFKFSIAIFFSEIHLFVVKRARKQKNHQQIRYQIIRESFEI
jgi:hypothetical protein